MDRMKASTHSEKRLPIAQELQIGRFVLKIDGDGPVCAWLFGGVTHVPPRLLGLYYAGHNRGATPKHFQTTGKDEGPSPLNSMECDFLTSVCRDEQVLGL